MDAVGPRPCLKVEPIVVIGRCGQRHELLDRAARLLRETDQALAAIAGAVGYGSEFALSRAFKRSRGIAPGRYRAAAA